MAERDGLVTARVWRRVVLITLDGVGVGGQPDAADFGDQEASTLPHVAERCGGLCLPTLERLGLGRIVPVSGVSAVAAPRGLYGRMLERARGKDTTSGHWELAGLVQDEPFSTYPQGFPEAVIDAFATIAGVAPLGNIAASGTEILQLLGEEHLRSGRPIVYTSVDSVFRLPPTSKCCRAKAFMPCAKRCAGSSIHTMSGGSSPDRLLVRPPGISSERQAAGILPCRHRLTRFWIAWNSRG